MPANLTALLRSTALLTAATGSLLLAGCAGSPVAGGVTDNRLSECPGSPNCVTSQGLSNDHQIQPFAYAGSPDQAMQRLHTVLNKHPEATIVTSDRFYLHAEFRTPTLGFVDDVEFLVGESFVQVRSASRLGYSDFGKNRERVEALRQQFQPCC